MHPLTNGFRIDRFPRIQAVAASSSTLLIRDTKADPDWASIPGLEWTRSLVLAPLGAEGETIGFLATLSDQPDYFHKELLDFLVTFAAYAAIALHHANIYQAELRARQTAETLSAVSWALTQTLELQTVLDLLLDYLHRLVPCDVGSVALLESESRLALRARFDQTTDTHSVIPADIDLLEYPHFRSLLESPQSTIVHNRADALAWTPDLTHQGDLSWLMVPIVAGGRVLGFCCLEKHAPDAVTPEHARVTEAVVGQAAVAIQNAWLFQQVRAGHDRLQSLSHRLVEVQERERVYVARELHDEAGQMLASLMLGLKLLEGNAHDPQLVVAGVRELRQVADSVQENLNRLAMDMRPASLDYLGLVAALNTFVNNMRDRDAIAVQFKAVGWGGERLAPNVEIAIYRIAQEALTNVVRHAKAQHVDVLLQRGDECITLMVEDDGIGFNPEEGRTHLGLVGMRERCEMLGGSLVVESAPGGGSTLVAEIPHVDPSTHM
jgi:signal transduction histidine kinase